MRLLIYVRLGRFPRPVLLIAQALGDSQAMAARPKAAPAAGSCTLCTRRDVAIYL